MDRPAMLRRALASLLVAVTLFTLISLLTFTADDLPWMNYPPPERCANWCGVIGANLAGFLIGWLGVASFIVVMLLAAWGASVLIYQRFDDLWMKVIGAALLLSAAAAAFGMLGVPSYAASWGGKLGKFYADQLGVYCSGVGAAVLIALGGVFGLIFLGIDHYAAIPVLALYRKAPPGFVRLVERFREKPSPVMAAAGGGTAMAAGEELRHAELLEEEPPTEEVVEIRRDEPPRKEKASAPEAAEEDGEESEAGGPDDERRQDEIRRRIEQRLSESIKKATAPPKMPKAMPDHRESGEGYRLPPIDILDDPVYHDASETQASIENNIAILETTLADFNIGAEVVDIDRGPVVTRYELALAPGIKVTRITSLADDIAMAVKAPSVRIVAPIPGKSTVGVEVPNSVREIVRVKELIASREYKEGRFTIPVLLGRDTSGRPMISDLTRMPHLLIAGATGSGKSVCINSIMLSILMTKRPEDLQLLLIDPKMVELSTYEGIPHLLCPVVTDMKRAPWILEWATKQMDERYDVLSSVGVRHITQFNALGEDEIRRRVPEEELERVPFHLPYVVIVIDELADLMMSSAKEVENSITRLAQKSRAVGIHILLATQRPSVDVITGLIKANMPTRISFQVTSKVDSRTILDRNGAEKLLGSGDLLFLPPGTSDLIRIQGTFVSDQEIKRIVSFVKQSRAGGSYKLDLDNWGMDTDADEAIDDDLYEQACRIVLETQRGSVSLLQRKLEIGYTRASRLMDFMAREGLVGAYKGSKAREVLTTLEEWEKRGRPEGYGPASRQDLPDGDGNNG